MILFAQNVEIERFGILLHEDSMSVGIAIFKQVLPPEQYFIRPEFLF